MTYFNHNNSNKPSLKTVSERKYNELKTQFNDLISNARLNEQLFKRFSEFESRLMESNDLKSLLKTMTTDFSEYFDIPFLKLVLEQDIFSHWHLAPVDLAQFEHVLTYNLSEHPELLVNPNGRLYMGATPKKISRELHIPINTLSFAQLPLVRNNKLIGMVNLGSPDSERFRPDMGTDFLERLTMIASLCFENACNMEQVRQLSLVDGLTQVCNRRAFDDILIQETSSAMRHQRHLACLFIDIDHFKRINDHYGHQVGDEALKQLAAQVKPLLRRSDHMARYGGEEFAILLPETNLSGAQVIAERIREVIADQEFHLLDQTLRMTLSIGVACMNGACDGGTSIEVLAQLLVKDADEQVYIAKKSGRNRVSCRMI
ncbi:DUF484 family protein [Litoribrevibacter euphylliae]|uniref:diguanylate cyclase n=1 Tax=Litoribrevibacter euphylliae TaxID=1834034 RepID=A0ABV7HDX0_9GAMM